ncbi:glycosyltransferase [Candidatus Avelusimicrobium facis]|uniref:glycosyltransferase family 2 protein n=1 Tax=Candidatus Avelusimicrobium facis TaxID=3416203 RepID=UPI0015B695F7
MAERITLFIIAKNEEFKISKCILSARELVSEIIVVDAFSKDKTAQVAKEFGAVVYQRAFDGFANQKNFALSKVSSPWALNLDADESLSPALVDEIRRVTARTSCAGFNIPFSNYFLGKRMEHSGLNKEYHLRLVRTDKAHYEGGLVHEGLQVNGTVGRLKNHIRHYSYESIETYFRKFNKYTSLAAQQMYRNGRRFSLFFVLITIPFEFIKRYLLKLGFLDGMRGFLWASFSAFYVFVKYMKLWSLQQKGAK